MTRPKDLTMTELLVLVGLATVARSYGRELATIIEGLPFNRVLTCGTIYPTLHALEKRGYVLSFWGDRAVDGSAGARRRYYSLTHEGWYMLGKLQNTLDAIPPEWMENAQQIGTRRR